MFKEFMVDWPFSQKKFGKAKSRQDAGGDLGNGRLQDAELGPISSNSTQFPNGPSWEGPDYFMESLEHAVLGLFWAFQMLILGMVYVGQFFAHELRKQGRSEVPDSLKYHTHLVVSIPSIVGIGDLVYMETVAGHGLIRTVLMHSCHPVNPTSKVAKARFAPEQGWSHFGQHLGLHVNTFPLGGIYVPGRRNIYNIVDDNLVPMAEVFAFARDLIEKKWPGHIKQFKFADQIDQGVVNEKPRGEKCASNACMKNELGVRLLYLDHRSRLQSIIDQIERSSSS